MGELNVQHALVGNQLGRSQIHTVSKKHPSKRCPLERTIICENTQSIIVCDSGVISIHHANYGRRDLVTCTPQTSHCYSPQTSSLRSRCNGRKSCHLNASNSVFSDPCWRVIKYLEVTYSCR